MAMKNPQEVARKWSRNLSGAGESIKAGVQAVTRSPTDAAAARQDAYVAGVERAAASGKWRRGLQRVTLQDWQGAMLGKGIQRIATGAQAAIPKMESFMGEWLPYMAGLQTKLQSMPRGDLNTNIARMVAAVEYNAQFQRSGAGARY